MRTQTITEEAATVAVAIPERNNRWIMIQNDSEEDASVFVKFDGSDTVLTADNGIEIRPGENLTIETSPGMPEITGPVQAVCAAGKEAVIRINEINFQAPE